MTRALPGARVAFVCNGRQGLGVFARAVELALDDRVRAGGGRAIDHSVDTMRAREEEEEEEPV